jgi:exodeoxyribonuclease VII small subunit
MPAEKSGGTKQAGFEEALERLKQINERFEKGELSLEEAIRLYREGIELAKTCEEQLSQAEQVVKKVVEETSGEISEEDFRANRG